MHTNGTPFGAVAAAGIVASNGAYGTKYGISGTAAVVASSVYTITLAPGIDTQNVVWFATPTSGALSAAVVQSADTTIAVSVFDAAGAAADGSFYLIGYRKGLL